MTPLVKADRAEAEKLPVIDRLLTKRFREEEAGQDVPVHADGHLQQGPHAGPAQPLERRPERRPIVAEAGIRIAFLAGEKDAVLSPATVTKAHELVVGSLLEIVPGAPHSMYWERPELFNAAVERLVDELGRN